MDSKILFGMKISEFKRTCILAPIVWKGLLNDLGIKNFFKGTPYSSGNSRSFTLIHSRVGAGFTGDAVLALKDSPCCNLIIIGSCGAINIKKDFGIGSIVCPDKCFDFESFSQLLSKSTKPSLIKSNINFTKELNLPNVTCATFGSILLEEKYKKKLLDKDIDIVDMEYSAFLNASKKVRKKAAGIFYISDIITKKHVYREYPKEDIDKIKKAQRDISRILIEVAPKLK